MDFTEILEKDIAAGKERITRLVTAANELQRKFSQDYNSIVMNIAAMRGEVAYCERKLAERKPQPASIKLAEPMSVPEGETELEQMDRVAKGDLRPGDPGYAEARKREEEALGKFGKEVYSDEVARALQG